MSKLLLYLANNKAELDFEKDNKLILFLIIDN